MAKYHINSKGEAGPCRAQAGGCPFGGAEDHYDSPEAAAQAYESSMNGATVAAPAKKRGLKELNDLAKTSSDAAIIEEILERGSDRTLRNLGKNPHATEDQLAEAAEKGSQDTVDALSSHPNFPVKAMGSKRFGAIVVSGDYAQASRLMGSNDVHDGHVGAAADLFVKTQMGRLSAALSNPDNKISDAYRTELAERSWLLLGAAQDSNRYPAERIADLPKPLVYWGNVTKTHNPAYLAGYADWAIRNGEDESVRQSVAHFVAKNPSTSAETLHKLVQNDLASVAALDHANVTDETRVLAQSTNPEAARTVKLQKLEEQVGGDLLKEVTLASNTVQPNYNRGLYDTTVRFDRRRLQELGMDREDVITLMGRGKFNGGSRYDETTGVFEGTVDSTD